MSYALNSLIEILDQILNPAKHHKNWVLDDDDEEEIQALLEKARSVKAFLEKPPPTMSPGELDSLEDEIISKAEEVENALESHITELILSTHDDDDDDDQVNFSISSLDLGEPFYEVEYQINLFKDAANQKPADDGHVISHIPESDDAGQGNKAPIVSYMRNHEWKLIVGLEQDLSDLKDRLTTSRSSKIEIIPIVGKRGAGKTTLAELIYHEYSSGRSSHFDVCAWSTVPRDSNSQKILRSLLACATKTPLDDQMSLQQLVTALHKELFGRKCLIVLDGIQNFTDWDKVQVAFNGIARGSRILLTTRKHDVADYVKSQSIHQMRPLNDDECWELLREKVYGIQSCLSELERLQRIVPLSDFQASPILLTTTKKKKVDVADGVNLVSHKILPLNDDEFWELMSKRVYCIESSPCELQHVLRVLADADPDDEESRPSKTMKQDVPDYVQPQSDKTIPLNHGELWELIREKVYGHVREEVALPDGQASQILTEHDVADYMRPMHPLNDDAWWEHVRRKVYDKEYLPHELEHVLRILAFLDGEAYQILLTTKQLGVTDYVKPQSDKILPLSDDGFWELLRETVYGIESCPLELEHVRSKVASLYGQASWILLTTRKHYVADYIKPQSRKMHPLNDEDWWEHVRRKVYGIDYCPHELEQVGRRIASNCKGLPLEVHQVGVDLSMVEKRKGLWDEFAVSLKSRNLVVGVDKDLKELKDRLLGWNRNLEIIPIVGMGGTGKTIVARVLFDELSSSGSHFEVCAWVAISQSYDPRRVLQSLLDCVTEKPIYVQEIDKLIETLHQNLLSRRYLILLDDIWSSEPMEHLRAAFPDNNRGSRIILTTRWQDVANNVHSNSHKMQPLNENDSWELLRRKVFDYESCPVELEEVGRLIANKCRGLPLAVQVVGGLLSQSERSKISWEHVAEDVSSFIENEDNQFSGIFSWSYFHLPQHLKPCFLYMGSFPEDYEIQASKLIKLWVSDGFLSPMPDRSIEEAAEKYLTDLVSRSLIIVRERKENFKVRSYGMHDLLRDLCLKKAHEKKFLYVPDMKTNTLAVESVHDQRRVCVHSSGNDNSQVKLTSLVRSFQPIGLAADKILSSLCFEFSLLRQLDLFETEFSKFPEEILKLVNLRFLALRCVCGLPESISVLRNLQTLIFQLREGYFALGMLDVPQIRHVKFKGSAEMNPTDFCRRFTRLENLHSLSTIPFDILKRLVRKIPNLRTLGFYFTEPSGSHVVVDLSYFRQLEILKCFSLASQAQPFSSIIYLPSRLRKVTLRGCGFRWERMIIFGRLRNLEVLKLKKDAFVGNQWNLRENEFPQLQFLLLEKLNLTSWEASSSHFPRLKQLVIRSCSVLKEIPADLGYISTLEIIEVDDACSSSVVASAKLILEEQRANTNEYIQVRIVPSSQ